MSYGRRSRAGLRALPPPSHSRGRKAPRAGSQAQDSGIFQHLPLGGASGPLWPLSPRRGPGSPGVPWRVLRLVARCAGQDRSPRRAHSAQYAQSRTRGLPRRKEEGLRDPAPRPTRRGKNPRLRDFGAPCRAPMRSPQPPALSLEVGRWLCSELPAFWHPVQGKSPRPIQEFLIRSVNSFTFYVPAQSWALGKSRCIGLGHSIRCIR